jgi:PAS domain S-box-containing protein
MESNIMKNKSLINPDEAKQSNMNHHLYLEAMIKDITDAVVSLDPGNLIVEWNGGAERLFGYKRDEVLNRNLDDLIGGNRRDEASKYTEDTFKRGMKLDIPSTIRFNKTGKPILVSIAASPITVGGKILGAVAVYKDISEWKKREDEIRSLKEFNEAIVTNRGEGILIENKEGIITFVNPSLCQMLGYSAKELIAKHWRKIVPDDVTETILSKTHKRTVTISEKYETRLLAKDGRQIPVWITATSMFKEEEFEGVLSAFTDITDLVEARKAAQSANEAKSEFLANMSH